MLTAPAVGLWVGVYPVFFCRSGFPKHLGTYPFALHYMQPYHCCDSVSCSQKASPRLPVGVWGPIEYSNKSGTDTFAFSLLGRIYH